MLWYKTLPSGRATVSWSPWSRYNAFLWTQCIGVIFRELQGRGYEYSQSHLQFPFSLFSHLKALPTGNSVKELISRAAHPQEPSESRFQSHSCFFRRLSLLPLGVNHNCPSLGVIILQQVIIVSDIFEFNVNYKELLRQRKTRPSLTETPRKGNISWDFSTC